MSASQSEQSREEKIATLRRLIESEDAFLDNQSTFEAYLSDPDPEVRVLAIRGLWDYPDPALVDRLMDIAKSDPDQSVRNRAITGLGRYVYEGEMADYDFDRGSLDAILHEDELPEESYRRVVAFLLDIVQDQSATLEAQRFGIEALGFASEPKIANLVERAYHDPDPNMKTSAVFAMGRSGLARWEPYVLAELDSPDPRMQLEAVRAAGELFLDKAAPTLLRICQSATDQTLRREAIWALGHTSAPEVWWFLDAIAQDPTEDDETRELAEAALDEYELFQEMDEMDPGFFEDEDFAGEDGGGNGYFAG